MPKKSLHYDFVNNPSLVAAIGPTLSITRATTATVMGSDGYLKRVASGEARFTGAQRRENLQPQSNGFGTTPWTLTRSSVAANSDSPDAVGGGSFALTENTDNNSHIIQSVTINPMTSAHGLGVYVFSVYVKPNGRDNVILRLVEDPATLVRLVVANFNVSTGALIGTAESGSPAGTGAGIEDAGNGWYRCWVYMRFGTNIRLDTSIFTWNSDLSTPTNPVYAGDGSSGVLIAGAQVEKVANDVTTPSAYIPTTTAAVRKVDYASSIASHVSRDGLRVEEARTNICLQSEDFFTTWVAGNANTTAGTVSNQTTAPDGSLTADKLLDNAATGTGRVHFQQNFTVSASTAYTVSVFAKADQLSWLEIDVPLMGALSVLAYFDLSNGVVGATTGANNTSQGIEDYGNGWYRCWITFTSDATDTSIAVRLSLADTDNDPTVDLDGTSSIFVWGAQLEAGAFPSSYIPTTTASATRNADSVLNTTDVSWYNEGSGSLYVQSKPGAAGTSAGIDFSIGVNAATDYVRIVADSSNRSFEYVNSTPPNAVCTPSSAVSANTSYRMSAGWATNDAIAYKDGTASAADTTVNVPTTNPFTRVAVGQRPYGGVYYNGHIKEIAYWPERLDNTTLADISSTGNFPAEFHAGMGLGFGKIGALGAY